MTGMGEEVYEDGVLSRVTNLEAAKAVLDDQAAKGMRGYSDLSVGIAHPW